MDRLVVEFDSRYRFPYRIIAIAESERRCLRSKHKSLEAAARSLAKHEKAEAYFETVKHRLAE